MPFEDEVATNLLAPTGTAPLEFKSGPLSQGEQFPLDVRREVSMLGDFWEKPQKTGFIEGVKAGFNLENPIASMVLDETSMVDNKLDIEFSPTEFIKTNKVERFEQQLLEANNEKMALAILSQALREEEDRQTAGANGWGGLIGGLAGGLLSPSMLVPGLGLIKATKAGYSVAKSAMATSALTGVSIGIDEAILQSTQQLRTEEESLIGIGSGLVLGGLVGGAVASYLTRQEARTVLNGYNQLQKHFTPEGLSAEAREQLSRDDLSVAGVVGNPLAKAFSEINPLLRAAFSPSAKVREFMQNLGEHTFYRKLHEDWRTAAPGGAAETEFFKMHQSTLGRAFRASDDIYTEMRKAIKAGDPLARMNRQEFYEAVGKALRRGDVGENEFVTRAAQAHRAEIYEPYKARGIEEGIFPPDVTVEEAVSYFHRVYQKERMLAEEFAVDGFKARIAPWMEQKLAAAFEKHREKINARIARLKGENADLALDVNGRVAALQEIDTALRFAATELRDAFDADQQAKKLMREAAKAKKAGDTARETELKTEARALRKAAKPFRDAAEPLLARRRVIEKGFGGAENKVEKYRQQLVDLEEANIGTLLRGFNALARLEQKLGKLPTADDLAESVAKFKEDFNRAADDLDAQLDHIADVRLQMDAEAEAFVKEKAEDATPQSTRERAQQFEEYKKALKPFQAKIDKAEARIKKDQELMQKLAVKIDEAELVDPVELQQVLREAKLNLTSDINSKMMARGERAQRLLDKIDALDPALVQKEIDLRAKRIAQLERGFYNRWEIKNAGDGVDLAGGTPKFGTAAKGLTDQVFDKIVGRNQYAEDVDDFEWRISPKSGPLKGRTLHFPDELIEKYLDSDARRVGEIFSRRMGGQLAVIKKFGNRTLEPQIREIQDDYAAIRQAIAAAPDYAAAKALLGDSFTAKDEAKQFVKGQPRTKEGLNFWLSKKEKDDIHDLVAVRDIILGRYKVADHQTPMGRLLQSANMFNYIRLSGRFLASSLPDIYRAPMVYGLNNWFGTLASKLRNNLTSEGLSFNQAMRKEAEALGLMFERVLNHKMMSVAEIADPFASGSAPERFLHNMTRWATVFNGMAWFQDAIESVNVPLAINRIANGVLEDKSGRQLAMLGIDKKSGNWAAIEDQLGKYAEKVDGMWVPNTHRWDDKVALSAFQNAVRTDVTRTSIRPGMGDVPLRLHTPIGKAFFQFRSFMLSANQRIMLAGLQEEPARFISGMLGMTTLGLMVSYFKAIGRGQEAYKDWQRKSENPGYLFGEALDHSGMFPMFFELSNSVEKVGKSAGLSVNPIKSPLVAAGGGGWEVDSQKTYGQDVLRAVAGPTFGLPTDAARAFGAGVKAASGEDLTKAQVRAIGTFMPYGSFIGLSDMVKILNDDHPFYRR